MTKDQSVLTYCLLGPILAGFSQLFSSIPVISNLVLAAGCISAIIGLIYIFKEDKTAKENVVE
jgi:hypothetical protein